MRIIFITCGLLALIISSVASDGVAPKPGTLVGQGSVANPLANNNGTTVMNETVSTTVTSTDIHKVLFVNKATSDPTATVTTSNGLNASEPIDISTSPTTIDDKTNITNATNPLPPVTTPATTTTTINASITTSVKPTTQPTKPTSSSPIISSVTPAPAPTSSIPTVDPMITTEIPSTPSKERHFDGLSFVGGIILATCLIAIGAFSWKFYRTCNEGNYRTL